MSLTVSIYVSFKKLSNEEGDITETHTKTTCTTHPGKEYVKMCVLCNVPCCEDCIVTDHNQHPCINISEAANEVRKDLELTLSSFENIKLPEIDRIHEELVNGIDKYNEFMEKAIEESRLKFRDLRQQLDNAEHKWLEMFHRRTRRDLDKMERMQIELETTKLEVQSLINTCKATLEDISDITLLSFQAELPDLELKRIWLPPVIKFLPSDYSLPGTEKLVGEIRSDSKRKISSRAKDDGSLGLRRYFTKSMLIENVVAQFDGYADCLTPKDKNEILAFGDEEIKVYNEDFQICHAIKLDFDVFDISYTPFNNIIVTDLIECRVMEISRSGEVNIILNTWPNLPGGILINDRDEIVIGIHDENGNYPKLVVYSNADLDILKEIENDSTGEPMFKNMILNVKQKTKGDYVVSEGNRIVCVERDGLYKWECLLGNDCVYGMACDQYDNIIIAKLLNHAIVILDSEGSLISTLLTDEDGILDPRALAIDSRGYLWIGQKDEIKVVQYIK